MTEGRPILAEYVRAGFVLVPIPLGMKGPVTHGWQRREQCITEPEIAEWLDGNVGLAHAYSGTCAIDVDNLDDARKWLADRQINLDELLAAPDAVRIESRPGRAKLIYRLTKPLPSFQVGDRNGLELRCTNSKHTTMQDVLPPSIHPDTGQPYAWKYNTPEAHWSKLPTLPANLYNVWASLIAPTAPKIPRAPREAGATAAKLRALLEGWSPDMGYHEWLGVGMALHHETNGSTLGLMLWNDWSSRGAKYKGIGDLETHWRSFRVTHDNPVTIASLRRDMPAGDDEFSPITEDGDDAQGKETSQQEEKRILRGAARDKALDTLRSVRRTGKGVIEARISNVVAVLSASEVSGYDLSLDEFADSVMISPHQGAAWRPLTDTDYTQMRVWLETAGNCDPIPHDMIRQAALLVADRQKMDTAQIWLESLKWDGVPRIDRFCPVYWGTRDTEYERAVGLYLWTALAARIISPGCQVDMVPVMIGAQGIGKSTGVKAMAPAVEHFAELRLDDADEAIARKMRGVLVAELAEMRGLRGAEVERVKAFITRTQEKWVPKYKEFATTYHRRFVIVGTTNDEEFLPTDTQHRRWLPVHAQHVDVARIKADREQLWAEGAVRYALEGVAWQGMDELAAPAREAAAGEDGWSDDVANWLKEMNYRQVRLQEVMTHAVGLDPRHVTRTHELRVGRILREQGYVRRVARVEGRVQKVWELDPTA